jgi:ferredoxin-NADP reductase
VHSIAYLARNTIQIALRASSQTPLPEAEPGAHIDVHIPNGLVRQYSLMKPAPAPLEYLIGVKRDEASRGGSAWLHENLRVGQALRISAPRNHFSLAACASHTVLVAGGIGITPIWAMAQRLADQGASWELHYAVRARAEAALVDELAGLGDGVAIHCDEEEGGRLLNVAAIVARQQPGAHLYCCGPAPMIVAFERATAHLDPDLVHVEHFAQQAEASRAGGFVIELARSGRTLEVAPGASILQTLLAAGVEVPHSCEQGVCGACETRVLAGEPDHRDSILTEGERRANRTMMVCCSGSRGGRLVLDL